MLVGFEKTKSNIVSDKAHNMSAMSITYKNFSTGYRIQEIRDIKSGKLYNLAMWRDTNSDGLMFPIQLETAIKNGSFYLHSVKVNFSKCNGVYDYNDLCKLYTGICNTLKFMNILIKHYGLVEYPLHNKDIHRRGLKKEFERVHDGKLVKKYVDKGRGYAILEVNYVNTGVLLCISVIPESFKRVIPIDTVYSTKNGNKVVKGFTASIRGIQDFDWMYTSEANSFKTMIKNALDILGLLLNRYTTGY